VNGAHDSVATVRRRWVATRHPWTFLIPAGLVTFAVWLPSLRNEFVMWDDGLAFLDNPNYRGLGPDNLRWMFTTFLAGHYQPLSWITLGFDYVLWGMNPLGYHLTNIVFHTLTAVMFGYCAAWIHEERRSGDVAAAGFSLGSAVFGSLVCLAWSLHPLRVEAVSWVTERREVLCGFLSLLAIASHLRRSPRWVTAVFAVLATLAKATAVTIPVIVVLVDLVRERPADFPGLVRTTARAVGRHAHLLVLAAAFSIVAILAQRDAKAIISYTDLLLSRRLALSLFGVAFCLQKTLMPAGLAPLHQGNVGMTWELHPHVWWSAAAGLGAVVCALAIGWARRRHGLGILAFTLAFLAMVLPTGGLAQSGPQSVADRYTYQSGWIATLAIGFVLAWAVGRVPVPRPAWIAAFGGALAVLGFLTVRQQATWRNTESLWKRQIEVYPASPLGHNQLGFFYLGRRPPDLPLAEAHFRRAIALSPLYLEPKCSLAGIVISDGRVDEGIDLLVSALRIKSDHLPALYLLAKTLWDAGRRDDALVTLEQLTRADPANPEAYRQLAKAQAAASRPSDAVASFDRGVAAAPSPELYSDFAWLLATHPDPAIRNGRKAVQMAEKAVAGGPSAVRTVLALAAARAEAGEFERAIAEVEAAIPGLPPEAAPKLRSLIADLKKPEPVRAEPRFP
jgi:tetratricopeptide (TPR) repeat protein